MPGSVILCSCGHVSYLITEKKIVLSVSLIHVTSVMGNKRGSVMDSEAKSVCSNHFHS